MGRTSQSSKTMNLMHHHPHVPDQHDQYACAYKNARKEAHAVGHKVMMGDIGAVFEAVVHVNRHARLSQCNHMRSIMT